MMIFTSGLKLNLNLTLSPGDPHETSSEHASQAGKSDDTKRKESKDDKDSKHSFISSLLSLASLNEEQKSYLELATKFYSLEGIWGVKKKIKNKSMLSKEIPSQTHILNQ